jgi:hypothetical protein
MEQIPEQEEDELTIAAKSIMRWAVIYAFFYISFLVLGMILLAKHRYFWMVISYAAAIICLIVSTECKEKAQRYL